MIPCVPRAFVLLLGGVVILCEILGARAMYMMVLVCLHVMDGWVNVCSYVCMYVCMWWMGG